jgi:hypothetical protein
LRAKKKTFVAVGLAFVLVVGFGLIPFETTVVPAWRLRLVDEHATPYAEIKTRESWRHYSLTLTNGGDEEERWSDRDGYVEFPRRTIRMSVIKRLALRTLTGINRTMHGSTGVHAYVMAWGPQGIKDINYEPNKPPPAIVVLPRQNTEAGNDQR